MQPLYPYFAIYRGPKQTEELKKYIYSHAQALNEIDQLNEELKESVTKLSSNCIDAINENEARASNIKNHLKIYLEGAK